MNRKYYDYVVRKFRWTPGVSIIESSVSKKKDIYSQCSFHFLYKRKEFCVDVITVNRNINYSMMGYRNHFIVSPCPIKNPELPIYFESDSREDWKGGYYWVNWLNQSPTSTLKESIELLLCYTEGEQNEDI